MGPAKCVPAASDFRDVGLTVPALGIGAQVSTLRGQGGETQDCCFAVLLDDSS